MKVELREMSLQWKGQALFQNLNMKFEGPGIIGILGASGCGKSTLLKILAGLQKPDHGEVVKPKDLTQGFVFQESHLLSWRTTLENVRLPLELSGHQQNSEARVLEALEQVGLTQAQNLFPHQLSGGMKMRASFARSFLLSPNLLFCDEPFGALDEITREKLQLFLRKRIMLQSSLCFFVTHSITEALAISDQIYYFKFRGKIEEQPYLVQHNNGRMIAQKAELRALLEESFQ